MTSNQEFKIKTARVFYFDNTIKIDQDIIDSSGKSLAVKGSIIRLFQNIQIDDLIIVDGSKFLQFQWAIEQSNNNPNITVMFADSDSKKAKRKIPGNIYYPDNAEYFIEKLGIKLFPAIVTQDGDRVKISEIILS